MRRSVLVALFVALSSPPASAAEEWKQVVNLDVAADTWATHDDKTLHGAEQTLKVGLEPQGCQTGVLGYDPCPKQDKVCCKPEGEFAYNFCAVEGHCESATPEWEAQRSFRGYLKFDLSSVPAGTVMRATLRLRQVKLVEEAGGPAKVVVTRLKDIQAGGCGWTEATLNDTNLTTWSSLPQNLSKSPEGFWSYDVTKAVRDWLTGDEDLPDRPIAPNCGFHLYDPDYPKAPSQPIIRWVEFGTKEANGGAVLSITVAKDLDGDGYTGDVDCDETSAAINPGVTEACDGVDNDCDAGVDNEVCDGVDNDCDGSVDEGEAAAICGPGLVCVVGHCEKSCQDDCDSAFDLDCRDAGDGVWQVLACRYTGEDACRHFVAVEDCPDGWFCGYGHCSKNCVDDFDCEPGLEGTKACQKDFVGRWSVMTCGQYDSDECLEWGAPEPCGKGADCADATCGAPCEDECEVGDRKCAEDGKVVTCWNFDTDPCWEWGGHAPCGEGASCVEGICFTPCEDQCTLDETRCAAGDGTQGVEKCGKFDGDTCTEWGGFFPCPSGECEDGACVAPCTDECLWEGATECADASSVRTCATGPDGCLHWGAPEACPDGCVGETCVAAAEPAPEVMPEATSEPGPDAGHEPAPDAPAEAAADVPAEGKAPGDAVGDAVMTDPGAGGSSSGGCSATGAGAGWVIPLMLLLAGLVPRRRGR